MEPSGALNKRALWAFGIISGLCLALFLLRGFTTGTFRYLFIPENLALAWLALLFGWLLVLQLNRRRWLSWQSISLTVLWLVFLPNTWYVLTDFLHVRPTGEISQLYDIVLMTTLVSSGFALGFASLYIVHLQFLKRLPARLAHGAAVAVLAISSFGIYLGRDLRWNTWDVLANPSGIILNVSDRVVDPLVHIRALNVTIVFFVLLVTLYFCLWLITGPHRVKHR